MLPSQRELFDIPRDVCYLNAAGWGPLPRATQEAGRAAVLRKGRPWMLDPAFAGEQHARARRAAAALVNAAPEDVALISSVGYGVATAAKLIDIPKGARVLVLQDDHASPMLEWLTRAPAQGFTVETVKQPADGDWTGAVLEAIERKGAAALALASISSIHWSDGGLLDLDRIAAALKRPGAALLLDATHSAGVMKLDVRALDPDFLVFPTYKWTLGPYGRAFLYVAKRRQDGVPLEQTGFARRSVAAESEPPYLKDIAYVTGAGRFDMGERDHFISMEMAAIGMELVASWGPGAIVPRLRMLTDRLAEGIGNSGATVLDETLRAPHVLSLGFPKGMPKDLAQRLAGDKVYAAPRLGRLRISPHVYNDEEDVDRFLSSFKKCME
jgi:selenocysteine lyase/cysteine desulfurase